MISNKLSEQKKIRRPDLEKLPEYQIGKFNPEAILMQYKNTNICRWAQIINGKLTYFGDYLIIL